MSWYSRAGCQWMIAAYVHGDHVGRHARGGGGGHARVGGNGGISGITPTPL